MKGQRVEPLLDEAGLHVGAERVDLGQIEERLRLHHAALVDDLHATDTLDDEQPTGSILRRCDIGRVVEAFGDLDERELDVARQADAGGRARYLVARRGKSLRRRSAHKRRQQGAGQGRGSRREEHGRPCNTSAARKLGGAPPCAGRWRGLSLSARWAALRLRRPASVVS
jgi:hypothetical protein